MRQHYIANKQVYIDRSAYRFHVLQMIAKELKLDPCMDCKVSYPYYVMHFDHRPGVDKKWHVSDYHRFSSISKWLEEVDKCDLVCANCHAKRTYQRSKQSV